MSKSVHTDQYKVFRQALISARKAAGLTQQDLAVRLMKPQSFVSKFELGERRLDVIEFISVARAIGIDPMEIINLVEQESTQEKM